MNFDFQEDVKRDGLISGILKRLGIAERNITDLFSTNRDNIPTQTWVPVTETWTFVSATSFTAVGDLTARYKKGTKVRWVQTTTKYGVIVSDSTYNAGTGLTTVTLIATTDYSVANATISTPYFSYGEPPDFPSAFNFTTVVTSGTGALGGTTVNAALWKVEGRTKIKFITDVTITNNGTGATSIIETIPITTASILAGTGRESVLTGNQLQMMQVSGQTTIVIRAYNNAYPGGANARMFGICECLF